VETDRRPTTTAAGRGQRRSGDRTTSLKAAIASQGIILDYAEDLGGALGLSSWTHSDADRVIGRF